MVSPSPLIPLAQLEGHELSYLRAIGETDIASTTDVTYKNTLIGVIILSAVLKRRMILADKAKSLFISKLVSVSTGLERC